LSAKVAVLNSGDDGRSVLYSRYNNGILPWGTPTFTG
jgi:hypothetical protein